MLILFNLIKKFMNYQPFLLLGISIFLTVAAHLSLKKGMTLIGELEFSLSNLLNLIFQLFQNIYLFLGLLFFATAFFFWLFVLSRIQLNIIYPISIGLNFALITIGSWFLFKEYLSLFQIIGIGFIIFGIFLLLKSFY